MAFHVFLHPFWCPTVSLRTTPGWETGMWPGHQPSPQMSARRVWRYLGMMQCDLRRWVWRWDIPSVRRLMLLLNECRHAFVQKSSLPEYIGFPWLSRDFFYGTFFFQVKLRQPLDKSKWSVKLSCRVVGSAKLYNGAKGGEGLGIWNVDSNSCRAPLEHVSTIGKRNNKKQFFFPIYYCCNQAHSRVPSLVYTPSYTWVTTMKSTDWHMYIWTSVMHINYTNSGMFLGTLIRH